MSRIKNKKIRVLYSKKQGYKEDSLRGYRNSYNFLEIFQINFDFEIQNTHRGKDRKVYIKIHKVQQNNTI